MIRPHLNADYFTQVTLAQMERAAAKVAVPLYAFDDQTALKVVDGTVEVVSEGEWKVFNTYRRTTMRKLIVTEYVTVDGIIEGFEEWFFPHWDDEIGAVKHAEMFASDALLFGRVTYQLFAAQWMPNRTDETGFADRLYNVAKYVVSAQLEEAPWNNSTIIRTAVADEVLKLKQQPGLDILVAGSATLVQTLRQYNLIDEYRLMVFPIIWGTGKRLFADGDTLNVKLVDTTTFGSGVMLHTYQPTQLV